MPLFTVTKKYTQYDYINILANTKEEAEHVALHTYKFNRAAATNYGDIDLDAVYVDEADVENIDTYVDATNFNADEYPVKEL